MSPILKGIVASGISGHLTPAYDGPYGAFDALSTVTVPSGGVSSVTFSGIPSGYKHLQVRAMHLFSGSGANLKVVYNGNEGQNGTHFIYGTGSTANAGYDTAGPIISFQAGATSTNFCLGIYDFLDYSNTSKTKVLRGLVSHENYTSAGYCGFLSGLSTTTSAINSLTFSYVSGATIQEFSSFALYGVK
jgi:hypothetical protein